MEYKRKIIDKNKCCFNHYSGNKLNNLNKNCYRVHRRWMSQFLYLYLYWQNCYTFIFILCNKGDVRTCVKQLYILFASCVIVLQAAEDCLNPVFSYINGSLSTLSEAKVLDDEEADKNTQYCLAKQQCTSVYIHNSCAPNKFCFPVSVTWSILSPLKIKYGTVIIPSLYCPKFVKVIGCCDHDNSQ